MKNCSLSIVVPCYNSDKRIVACINAIKLSIENLPYKLRHEIIVVDDGSEDETAEIVSKIDGITIITHLKNKGLSAARNSGIHASQSEYIAFIDSDIILEKSWFYNMLDLFMKDDSILGITGQLKYPLTKKTKSLIDLYLFSNYRGIINIDKKSPLLYKWFVFSNTIIRRNILEKTGVFDEGLISYGGEDTELSIRINKKFPANLRKLNDAVAYHYCDKSLRQYSQNMYDYGLNNFNHIVNKHPDYKDSLGYDMVNSFKGYIIFNPINKFLVEISLKFIKHPLLIKFLVVYSFIKGARSSKK